MVPYFRKPPFSSSASVLESVLFLVVLVSHAVFDLLFDRKEQPKDRKVQKHINL